MLFESAIASRLQPLQAKLKTQGLRPVARALRWALRQLVPFLSRRRNRVTRLIAAAAPGGLRGVEVRLERTPAGRPHRSIEPSAAQASCIRPSPRIHLRQHRRGRGCLRRCASSIVARLRPAASSPSAILTLLPNYKSMTVMFASPFQPNPGASVIGLSRALSTQTNRCAGGRRDADVSATSTEKRRQTGAVWDRTW